MLSVFRVFGIDGQLLLVLFLFHDLFALLLYEVEKVHHRLRRFWLQIFAFFHCVHLRVYLTEDGQKLFLIGLLFSIELDYSLLEHIDQILNEVVI